MISVNLRSIKGTASPGEHIVTLLTLFNDSASPATATITVPTFDWCEEVKWFTTGTVGVTLTDGSYTIPMGQADKRQHSSAVAHLTAHGTLFIQIDCLVLGSQALSYQDVDITVAGNLYTVEVTVLTDKFSLQRNSTDMIAILTALVGKGEGARWLMDMVNDNRGNPSGSPLADFLRVVPLLYQDYLKRVIALSIGT